MENTFAVGDRVRIVDYGHDIVFMKTKDGPGLDHPVIEQRKSWIRYDISPELVGQIGVVDKVMTLHKRSRYALTGVLKYAWYNEDQLISANTKTRIT